MTLTICIRVRSARQVLTYPSWCVIRRHREVPEATKALKDAILNAFTDALDGTLVLSSGID